MVYLVCWLDKAGRYARTVVGDEAHARQKATALMAEGLTVAVSDERGELLDLQVEPPKAPAWTEGRAAEEPGG